MKIQLLLLLGTVFVLIPTVILLLTGWVQRWIRLPRERAFLTAVAALLVALAAGAQRVYELDEALAPHGRLGTRDPQLAGWLQVAGAVLLGLLAVPFATKLYLSWLAPRGESDEDAPGLAGVRAWLSPAKVILAGLIAVCAAAAYDCQFAGMFVLLVGCLLVRPLVSTMQCPADEAPVADAFTAEREKVLSLLEAGRITAEESAELLNALGSSAAVAKAAPTVSKQRRLLMLGAALVLLGFYLPWLSLNPGREMGRLTQQLQLQMPTGPLGMNGEPVNLSHGFQVKTPTVHQSGGDMEHGVGWLVLLAGLGVAALPFALPSLDDTTRRTVSRVALGLGALVMLWLITNHLRFLNAGLLVTLAGYVIEFLGTLDSRGLPARQPVVAET